MTPPFSPWLILTLVASTHVPSSQLEPALRSLSCARNWTRKWALTSDVKIADARRRTPAQLAAEITSELIHADWQASVVHIEHANASTARLAEHHQEHDRTVIYEPTGRGSPAYTKRLLVSATVVKCSAVVVADPDGLGPARDGQLWIQSLGDNGLRHRTGHGTWCHHPAIPPVCIVDTEGAGDWLTAALINGVLSTGSSNLDCADIDRAQQTAARSIEHAGPRGLQYRSRRSGTIPAPTGPRCPNCRLPTP